MMNRDTKYRKRAMRLWEEERAQTAEELQANWAAWSSRLHKAVSQIGGWLTELQTRVRRRPS
ncbi:hypothetical protein DNH61_09195 [Paenibacillus sambharensis]|uniref:Uncharacterized protein n=1 Tax=Paenibacillus sambharensis TaxID=1803190 RepID=A0A2W1LM82_9BACL|nr:hypothetical protein [Paenibacillus sambharensis]PZD96082.1 hypothetical protein DNH61_09195 [Paenibacillus sambharensis]